MALEEANQPTSRGTGTWTRVGIGLQVSLAVLLAAVVAVLLTWLSSRPGLYRRVDLTAEGRQTLDESLTMLIENLPRKVTAEVFFRPLDEPLDDVGREVQGRMMELLIVARNQHPEQLKVIQHDLGDLAAAAGRMQELGVDEPNVVVLHDGERQAVLRLFRDLARVDPGNPATRTEPSMDAFLGDQALGDALLRLGIDGSPKVYFSTGQGERELFGTEILQLAQLQSALASDGFEVSTWSPSESPNVPRDCDVLAVVDPRQPFPPEALESMHRFLAGGGRLLVTPSQRRESLDGPGSMAEFLRRYGIEVQAGFVGTPLVNSLGQVTYGDPRCGIHYVRGNGMDRRHPVTESLFSLERSVVMNTTRAFKRGTAPENGVLLDILRSSSNAWIDLTDPSGRQDWRWNQKLEESGSFTLAVAAWFQATDAPLREGGDGAAQLAELGTEEVHVARILALGTPDALGNGESGKTGPIDVNRDFALNAFNWLASRDHRMTIRPREYVARSLDLAKSQRPLMNLAVWILPGLCLLMGTAVWWRRRR